jgi:hypothetical protein
VLPHGSLLRSLFSNLIDALIVHAEISSFRFGDLNEAARAADASREANVAVYGEWLK